MPDEIEQRLAAKEQALTDSADPRGARDQLKNQVGTVTQRLDAMDAERRQLLTQ